MSPGSNRLKCMMVLALTPTSWREFQTLLHLNHLLRGRKPDNVKNRRQGDDPPSHFAALPVMPQGLAYPLFNMPPKTAVNISFVCEHLSGPEWHRASYQRLLPSNETKVSVVIKHINGHRWTRDEQYERSQPNVLAANDDTTVIIRTSYSSNQTTIFIRI